MTRRLVTTPHADLVYEEIKQRTNAAILQLVEKEREGELIDRTLVKNILGIFIDVGMGGMEYYERDFEAHLLLETATFYKRKAAQWIEQDSCPDYLIKAEQCLKEEEERVDNYLHSTTKQKLLKEVENEVLTKYEAVLLQKEHSGCAALLRDDKVGHGCGGRGGMRGGGAEPTGKLWIQHIEGLQGEAARWRGSAEGCFESHKGGPRFCRAGTHTTVSMDLTLQPPRHIFHQPPPHFNQSPRLAADPCCRPRTWRACSACSSACPRVWSLWRTSSRSTWSMRAPSWSRR